MYGIPNGTLEADQAANVPALGRNKSCVCHVCAGLAHARHTHTSDPADTLLSVSWS